MKKHSDVMLESLSSTQQQANWSLSRSTALLCAEASKNETGDEEGIEVLKNEPYKKHDETEQNTHKICHLKSKVPAFMKMIAPEGSLVFHKKAWNAYPYCRNIVTNEYMEDDFFIKIETWHNPDLGTVENVHGLEPNTWKAAETVHINIADRSQVEPADYKADEDWHYSSQSRLREALWDPTGRRSWPTSLTVPDVCL